LTSPKSVISIVKGADILGSLSNGTDRISDLSNKLYISKSTTHRLLKIFVFSLFADILIASRGGRLLNDNSGNGSQKCANVSF
jgi:hypothetical protein